jgi:hypothetical protein
MIRPPGALRASGRSGFSLTSIRKWQATLAAGADDTNPKRQRGRKRIPRWRFGLVWKLSLLAADFVKPDLSDFTTKKRQAKA